MDNTITPRISPILTPSPLGWVTLKVGGSSVLMCDRNFVSMPIQPHLKKNFSTFSFFGSNKPRRGPFGAPKHVPPPGGTLTDYTTNHIKQHYHSDTTLQTGLNAIFRL